MLSCRTEYLTPFYLASEQIRTPDPCRDCFYGQQLVIRWNLPYGSSPLDYNILLHLRYGTKEIEAVTLNLNKRRGYWIYRLINADYWCREGIIAYKAELYFDGNVIWNCAHHLWTDIISITATE